MLAHAVWGACGGRLRVFIRHVHRLVDAGEVEAVSIVPHDVGQLDGLALGGIHFNVGGGGVKGRFGAWGLINRGVRDGTGPILLRGLRRGTYVGGGLRVGPLGDKLRGPLAAGAGSPGLAGVTPL